MRGTRYTEAAATLRQLVSQHPDYAAGYFMAAQTLAKAGRNDEARTYLQDGISAASRTGNAHAKGEMFQIETEDGVRGMNIPVTVVLDKGKWSATHEGRPLRTKQVVKVV